VAIATAILCASSAAIAQDSHDHNSGNDVKTEAPPHAGHRTASDGPPTPLAELIAEGLAEHPTLVSKQADVQAARARVDGVGLRPDPMVSLTAMAIPWNPPSLDSNPMTAIQIGVAQPLWWPGELDALEAAAEAKAEAIQPSVDEARIKLLLSAAEIYYDIYAIDRRVEALQRLKPPIEELIELLTARIATGKASIAQVERARLVLLRVDDDIFMLRHERPGKVARLNALLNRPPQSHVRPPIEGHSSTRMSTHADHGPAQIDPDEPLARLDELVERGMENRPIVDALKLQKASARAESDAAQWQAYPRLEVFGSWQMRFASDTGGSAMDAMAMASDGADTFSIGVRGSLPIWSDSKADAAEDVARAKIVSADAAIDAFRLQLRGELAGHLAELHHLYNHARFYREELIPQAERAREAALAGLEVGRADYESWLAAEQRLVELQAKLVTLNAGILKHHALTNALIGEFPGAGVSDVSSSDNSDVNQLKNRGSK
jgi:outer membrane protein TolC